MPRSRSIALTAGKYNVYLPSTKSVATFDSLAKAQAHVKAQKAGVILDPKGLLNPAHQKWSGWSGYQTTFTTKPMELNPSGKAVSGTASKGAHPIAFSEPEAAALKPTPSPTPGQVNLFIPAGFAKQAGLPDSKAFKKFGAYLPFESLKAAQAYATKHDRVGIVLGADGSYDTKAQLMKMADGYSAQRFNSQLAKQATPNAINVWFPPKLVAYLGMGEGEEFAGTGAYLSFPTLEEAKAHVRVRSSGGVIFDQSHRYNAADQVWKGASRYSQPPVAWPPPPVSAQEQKPKAGTADIVGVYANKTPAGAQMVVRTHSTKAGEELTYQLFVTVAGVEMKMKELGTQKAPARGYIHDATFDLDFKQISDVLKVLHGKSVKKGETVFGVRVSWPGGHNQGSNGAGGDGAHRFIAP